MRTGQIVNGKIVWDKPFSKAELQAMAENFTDMLADRRPPLLHTDTSYQAVLSNNGQTLAKQFSGNESQLKRVVKAAKARGYTPCHSDTYYPELADYPGDPKAFIRNDHRAHIRKVCESKGVACLDEDGNTIVKHRQDEPKKVRLAEDIIERERQNRIAKDPGLKHRDQRELREQIIEEHAVRA